VKILLIGFLSSGEGQFIPQRHLKMIATLIVTEDSLGLEEIRSRPWTTTLSKVLLLLALFFTYLPCAGAVLPPAHPLMQRAHSHNDYHQNEPLFSALRHGIRSIEVDVFPRDNKLWVAHTIFELNPSRVLDSMYIAPLVKLFQQAGQGSKAKSNNDNIPLPKNIAHGELLLLVDLKANPEKSIKLLHEALMPLRPYLTRVDKSGVLHPNHLTVLISGNRPKHLSSLWTEQGDRVLFLDGRLHDMKQPVSLVPVISLSWQQWHVAKLSRYRSVGGIVQQAHGQGKRLRVWGAPPAVWKALLNEQVDLIGIDHHELYANVLGDGSS
jgi:hypothetical protein